MPVETTKRRSFPYSRTGRLGDVRVDMVLLRRGIAGSTIASALAAAIALASPGGPQSAVARPAMVLVLMAAAVAAVLWWRGPWPGRPASLAFVAFSDLAIAIGLASYADPLLAVPGACLFITVGIYVSLVHEPPAVFAHVAWCVVVVAALVGRVAAAGDDVAMALSMAVAVLIGVAGLPLLTSSVWGAARQAAWDSLLDPLTGLLNRRGLAASVGRLPALQPDEVLAVAVVDLDAFKAVNDREGHAAGDEVLRVVSARLLRDRPPAALCARTGGEEFALVAPIARDRTDDLGRRVVELVHRADDEVPVSASVGVATVARGPAGGVDVEQWLGEVLCRADDAMYRAKRRGGACAVVAPASGSDLAGAPMGRQ